jgi:multidrug efflux system outer membrane protein
MVLACACAACTLGPDYARPSIDTPDSFRFAEAAPGDHPPPELADVAPWWEGFNDPQLSALVREGLASNRNLHVAVARVDEFAARLSSTRSQRFPQVGYGASATRQDPLSDSYAVLLSASWELDLWGRIRRETEAARADLLGTEQARRGVALTVVAAVITGYINLLDLDRQLKISQDTLKVREASVKVFRQRFEGGTISDFEMQQVLAEHEIAVAAIPQAQRAIAVQEDALSVLLGRNPGPIARAAALEDLALPTVAAGIPAELLERRPDILQAEQALVAANARVGVGARAVLPADFPDRKRSGRRARSSTDCFLDRHTLVLRRPVARDRCSPAARSSPPTCRRRQDANRRWRATRAPSRTPSARSTTRWRRSLPRARCSRLRSGAPNRCGAPATSPTNATRTATATTSSCSIPSAACSPPELSLSSARGDSYRSLVELYRALGGDFAATDPLRSRRPPIRPAPEGGHEPARRRRPWPKPPPRRSRPPAPAAAAIRRAASSSIALLLLFAVLAYKVIADRLTPYSAQALVDAPLAQIAPQVAGQVVKLDVVDNARVKKGQLLFEIDREPFEIAVRTAEANLERRCRPRPCPSSTSATRAPTSTSSASTAPPAASSAPSCSTWRRRTPCRRPPRSARART